MYYSEPTRTLYDLRFERVGEPDAEIPHTVEIEHGVRTVKPLGLTWLNGEPIQFQLNDISHLDSRPFLSNRPEECHPGLHNEPLHPVVENSDYVDGDYHEVFHPITPDGRIDVLGADGQVHTLQLRFLYLTGERAIGAELECPFPENAIGDVVQLGSRDNTDPEYPPLRLVA